jgi:hypothetical protein
MSCLLGLSSLPRFNETRMMKLIRAAQAAKNNELLFWIEQAHMECDAPKDLKNVVPILGCSYVR